MTHLGYIVAAYLSSALVLGGMTAFMLADLRAKRRELERLGGLRRAGGPPNRAASSQAVTLGLDPSAQEQAAQGPRVKPEDDAAKAADVRGAGTRPAA